MKIVIIGGGNMGSSIAKGLVQGTMVKPEELFVIDLQQAPLDALKAFNSGINTVLSEYDPVKDADIIMLAVKPWLIKDLILDIKFLMNYPKQILISIAAGISIQEMESTLLKHSDNTSLPALFRVVPNTAIEFRKSLTLITSRNAGQEQSDTIISLFNELGSTLWIDEDHIAAGTALTSCGIAFFFRYVRAATAAAVEMGFSPEKAREMISYTMLGAAEVLLQTGNNPEVEIDKVTTPGGITIKGLNELEANGFSNAVIKGLKACKN